MGTSKQLLLYHGKSLVEHAVDEARGAGFDPLIVVTGAESQAVRSKLARHPVAIVENEQWRSGMGSSIAAGVQFLQQLQTDSAAAAILLVDQPLVNAAHFRAMRSLFSRAGSPIVAARYGGALGVPALFSRPLFSTLAALRGDAGARSLLRDPDRKIAAFELPEAAVDVDTPEEFASLPARD